ncbi:hypothetical protein Tco_1174591 [Tanacetum coccineum]
MVYTRGQSVGEHSCKEQGFSFVEWRPPIQNVVPTAKRTDTGHNSSDKRFHLSAFYLKNITIYHTIKLRQTTQNQHRNAIISRSRTLSNPFCTRTEYQLADMFTKALPEDRFKYLVRRIGMRCLTPAELEVVRLGINPMIQPEPEDLPKDNPKLEIAVLSMSMLVKDTRSQDGKDDKDNDKGSKSRSQSMKEQAYNEDKDQEHSSLNDKSNLTDLMKECHQ